MQQKVLDLLSVKRGHFLLESGHHGDLWLDLETLCLRPRLAQSLAAELATSLSQLAIDAVCGPLVEGAFVALMTASHLDVAFTYSERYTRKTADGLFPSGYRIPGSLRNGLRGKRVAIVNDVINAGSAVRGTFSDLEACGANVVAINALLVLGSTAARFAASKNVPLNSLAQLPNALWTPSDCQLCASGLALEDVASFSTAVLE